MYQKQLKEAELRIEEEKLERIKEDLKKRLEKRIRLFADTERNEKEITLLVEEGKLENLEDYIKIDHSPTTVNGIQIDVGN